MKSSKIIRDPIHGNIGLTDFEVRLLDSRPMQRLRNIKQNGFCYLVYPAMNSTRFEHSLGVMHLAGLMASHLDLVEKETMLLKSASLLHDIGHAPFSHSADPLLSRLGVSHEINSSYIVQRTEVADVLKDYGIRPKAVADIIMGEGVLGKLLASEIDVDKMDYLIRDAYYAGVAYGVIDLQRVLYNIKLVKDDVVIDSRGLEAVEFLLISRNMMYQTVYRHHTKRIAESMFTHALGYSMKKGLSVKELLGMDDISLMDALRSSKGYAGELARRLNERRLFKIVFQERISDLTDSTRKELEENCARIEAKISRDFRIRKGFILVDYPESKLSEFRVKVEHAGEYKTIDQVSSLAKSLEHSESEKLTVNICVSPEELSKFKNFNPEKYLNYVQTSMKKYL